MNQRVHIRRHSSYVNVFIRLIWTMEEKRRERLYVQYNYCSNVLYHISYTYSIITYNDTMLLWLSIDVSPPLVYSFIRVLYTVRNSSSTVSEKVIVWSVHAVMSHVMPCILCTITSYSTHYTTLTVQRPYRL